MFTAYRGETLINLVQMSEHWESHWWSTTLMNHARTWLYRYMYIFLSMSVNRERAESHIVARLCCNSLKPGIMVHAAAQRTAL